MGCAPSQQDKSVILSTPGLEKKSANKIKQKFENDMGLPKKSTRFHASNQINDTSRIDLSKVNKEPILWGQSNVARQYFIKRESLGIENTLARFGLAQRIPVDDGNCQFRALAEQLYVSFMYTLH